MDYILSENFGDLLFSYSGLILNFIDYLTTGISMN